jgi:hypothetical protein
MSAERENEWDGDFLRSIPSMSLDQAQKEVCALIESGTTRPSKKAHLIRDIKKARSSAEVSRIMYNAMLAGSGLGTVNSPWQKLHGAAK